MQRSHLRLSLAVSAIVALALTAACGTRQPSSSFASSSPAAGGTPSASTAGTTSSAANLPASDVGVTPSTITIGEIVSKTNPFAPQSFAGPTLGLTAFVRYVNDHGGINGRQLILRVCDDQGSATANETCAHTLINTDHVFALVSNAAVNYAGASFVNSKGVPDIGGQPIDNAYNTYRHLFDIYSESYPRDGKPGVNGNLYGGGEVYAYFKHRFPTVPLKAGVVEFNQGASERYGNSIAEGLRLNGYTVDVKVVNFVLPNFDSAAISFKQAGVRYVYDALDSAGNVKLCDALEQNNVPITAKVLTTQGWNQSVNADYAGEAKCRNELWATGNTRNYEDTQYPQVAAFRQEMTATHASGPTQLSEWALEGWAGGRWFADAAKSCGADLTRSCVETYMNRNVSYDGDGLLTPRKFTYQKVQPTTIRNCINVVRWVSSEDSWVTQVPNMNTNCFTTTNFAYPAG